ncbi:MAG: Lrp/AsnC family transcriptional regulator [Methanothrix sp.]|jgi:DNA-binding Lrp family transcriptional regulator|nr:Lrp/AsnC family transcriptional regulator [Methanothrix sp.]
MQLKLTSKERLVLYGLARYPGLSDIDLASNIGVDRSTIFKSKRKFRDWKLIKLLNVPSGESVSAEILTSVFVKYSPTAPFEVRLKSPSYQRWVSYPNCVSHIATDTDSVSNFYSRSLTDFRLNFDAIIDEYYRNDFVEDIQYFHYPFQVSSYSADAALAVNGLFDLDRSDLPGEVMPPREPLNEEGRLTEKDKLTLYAFVKYPMLSDLELSRRTGISRPTISGKRTKFFQSGLLTREAYVDWQKICCELMSFYHVRIRHGHDREDLSRVYQAFRRIGAPLFSYLQPGEIFGAFLSTGYPELKSRMDKELRSLSEEGLIKERPMLVIMPLSEIKASKIDYAPMVAKMLEIEKEI